MARSGLSEFKHVLTDFRQLGSLALKGVVAAPWADFWLKLGPPPVKTVAVLTSLLEFITVIWVFQYWYSLGERQLKIRMKVAAGLFCAGIISSLTLMGLFTVYPGGGRERVVEGWIIREDVKPLLNSSRTPEQVLMESEYDPDRVWTKESVVVVRMLITTLWLATFACLAIYLTVFITLQRRRSFAHSGHMSQALT